jgi:hypothetical protein
MMKGGNKSLNPIPSFGSPNQFGDGEGENRSLNPIPSSNSPNQLHQKSIYKSNSIWRKNQGEHADR